jgi:hypothetical protein
MNNFINIPRIPIIVFELLKFPVLDKELQENLGGQRLGSPKEADIVVMDVLPTEISYDYASKKTMYVGYGDNNNVIDRAGNAPTQISFSGSFGKRMIRRGIQMQDGFGRLKEFRELYRKSQTVEDTLEDALEDNKKYIYGLNFYDFTFHYWGAVDLDRLRIRGDAGHNSQLPFYNVSMTGIGPLIDVVRTIDPILRNLKILIKTQESLDKMNAELDKFISENPIASTVNEIVVDIESLDLAIKLAKSMSSQYLSIFTNTSIIGDSALLNAGTQLQQFSFTNFAELL